MRIKFQGQEEDPKRKIELSFVWIVDSETQDRVRVPRHKFEAMFDLENKYDVIFGSADLVELVRNLLERIS